MSKERLRFLDPAVEKDINILDSYKEKRIKSKIVFTLIMILFLLQSLDFILTWYGINITQNIIELNVFMFFLFKLSFIEALIIRLFVQVTVSLSFYYLSKYAIKNFKVVMFFSLFLNMYILYRHLIYTLAII